MIQHNPKNSDTVTLFSGLGRTLAISFLIAALVPMALISVISYNKAYDSLDQEIRKGLKNGARLKTREIGAYFDRMLAQLRFQSESEVNAKLLEDLRNAREISAQPPATFVKSFKWAVIVDNLAGDIINFRRTFNYHDIFLIGKNGDILFTVAKETDLGTNLFTGTQRSSLFTAACKRTLETGNISFSDYERYAVSKDLVYGFITAPVVNQEGERIGVMAFQFGIDPITRIMESGFTLGKTAETYLVGPDLTLRSGLTMDKTKALIQGKIRTDQTTLLKQHLDDKDSVGGVEKEVFVYKGPHGKSVLGIHYEIEIVNVIFAVIAEIDEAEAFAAVLGLRRMMLLMVGFTGLVVIIFVVIVVRQIVRPVIMLSSGTKRVEEGDYSQLPAIRSNNEISHLAGSFNTMVQALKKNRDENRLKEWFQKGQMELNAVMRGNLDLAELSRNVITFLARYLDAGVGAIYIANKDNRLRLTGSYAFSTRKRLSNEFDPGQGLVGQAALEKERIILTQVPEDYIVIRSGLGETPPQSIVVKPFMRDDRVMGVIELGTLDSFSDEALGFLDSVEENVAVGVQTIQAHMRVQDLLEQSQTQAEELEAQQEELRHANESLEKQTAALKVSEANLQAQQEELRQTNEELEEQTRLLEEQKNSIGRKNIELEKTRSEIEQKAKDLDIASRYKSEFLANMSHELRTPLNSILLLSKHLSDNRDGNLTEKQAECASTVYTSGNELLALINEVLDLAKVEAGKMILEYEDTAISDIAGAMERNFRPVSENSDVDFDIRIDRAVPETIRTDTQRLSQILKNLLSNAFKFTEKGSVTLEICHRDSKTPVTFMVKDTGVGIARDKQETVFQAFKQADGSTSRKYGGTGLGLSISRELAQVLGGTLELSSTPGRGSVFTLSLPVSIDETAPSVRVEPPLAVSRHVADPEVARETGPESPAHAENLSHDEEYEEYVPDDRKTITETSRSILIIEDDPNFAKILRDTAREKGFKALVAESGETGLHLTDLHAPDGIILDMALPGMDGKAVLFRLKENLATRHIPVHIVSAADRTIEPMHMGAVGYLTKPVTMEAMDGAFARIEGVISKKVKKVLLVEDNEVVRRQIKDLIGSGTVGIVTASTGSEAKKLLGKEDFDCMILDLGLPDISGMDLLSELRKEVGLRTPVIIHTAKDLSAEELAMLDGFSSSIVIKDATSPEKLLDNACLFLHRVAADLPENKKEMIKRLHDRDSILESKKILIVDDDMRNVFSLISILEDNGVNTVAAGNGTEALARLRENPDTDLVLMDIMMPEMDGYTAMNEIRKMSSKISKIPIITLTAKAMKGDRAKCIEAGANDYLSKPVDADKLLSMLRVWLY